MPRTPADSGGSDTVSPEEAFALLGNETRVGILQALWAAFESGTGDNAVAFSALYDDVDIRDSGNFSYHLEKLTGPFVRRTDEGYELKQTGINVVRAVMAGTVTTDPTIDPIELDVECPLCEEPLEIAYADELVTVRCTSCPGMRTWNGRPGFLFASLVPPAGIEGRSPEAAFRAGVAHTLHQAAALRDGVCPHCASEPEVTVDVCPDHRPGERELCPACGWKHLAEVWLVCSTCKRSMYPPLRAVVLDDPNVTAFYHEHGVGHRYASWEGVVRSFDVGEELLSADPLEMRLTVPARDDELLLTVDGNLDVVDAA